MLLYFFIWRDVRGIVTQYIVLPQIEYAQEHCSDVIHFDVIKPTSLRIHLLDEKIDEYYTFSYTAPAGFYLLMGLVLVILLNGRKIHFQLLLGFHFVFWILSTVSIYPGLCVHSFFMHFTNLGIKYFTPFVTFIVIILVVSPKFRKKLERED